jgi:hypothetical protein
MLLEWIDPANRHLHTAEVDADYSDADVAHTTLNAYADDLATLTGGPNAERMQQLVATWLTAFGAFSGLVMHAAKIYSTILDPVPRKYDLLPKIGPLFYNNKVNLVIHDLNWNPISCPILPHASP